MLGVHDYAQTRRYLNKVCMGTMGSETGRVRKLIAENHNNLFAR